MPNLRRRLVAGAVMLVSAAVAYLVFLRTLLGQKLDEEAYLGRPPGFLGIRSDLLHLGVVAGVGVAILVVLVCAARQQRPVQGVAAAAGVGIAVGFTELLKEVLPRPQLLPYFTTHNTFPSGHSTAAGAAAVALLITVPRVWRGLISLIAEVGAAAVVAGVQAAGWHRSSDAIAGVLVGAAVVLLTTSLAERWGSTTAALEWRHRRPAPAGAWWRPGTSRQDQPVSERVAVHTLAIVAAGLVVGEMIGLGSVIRAADRAFGAQHLHGVFWAGMGASVLVLTLVMLLSWWSLGQLTADVPEGTSFGSKQPGPGAGRKGARSA